MIESQIVTLAQDALKLAVALSAPAVVAAIIVGLLLGILQTATQLQEQSLSTGARLLVVHLVLMLLGAWMLSSCVEFLRHALWQVKDANL